jgi:hypothetical protein
LAFPFRSHRFTLSLQGNDLGSHNHPQNMSALPSTFAANRDFDLAAFLAAKAHAV